jgi:hypothetical protein
MVLLEHVYVWLVGQDNDGISCETIKESFVREV